MPRRSRVVLVVDDERFVREALRRLLESQGYVVHAAGSGQEGLAALEANAVQLVISDKDMPGMSGIEFLDLVRDRFPRVCRMMLSGRADLDGALAAINRGEVYRFLEKPFSTEHLLVTVHAAFETIELEEDNRRLVDELRRERERSDQLLNNILPAPIAERLKQGEVGIADRFPSASVLFSDLVCFTELSTVTPPGVLVSLLNDVFSAFDDLVGSLGVEKIKTLGDGYLAVAGVPKARPDHARAIAELAMGMLKAVEDVNARRGLQLQLRIGIHTGPVVAGVIGLRKFSYDLWGDTVNVASRMESSGAPGRIHATEEMYRALASTYLFEARGLTDVKGKGMLPTWFLSGRLASQGGTRQAPLPAQPDSEANG